MKFPASNIVVHADSGPSVGWGHLSRATAIAQACLRIGARPLIVSETAPDWLKQLWHKSAIENEQVNFCLDPIEMAGKLAHVAASHQASAILLDGYRFGDEYETALTGQGIQVAAIDDYGHAQHRTASLIVNPNVYAAIIDYPVATCPILKGPSFVLLRDDVRQCSGHSLDSVWQSDPHVERILISLGGADTENTTGRALCCLGKCHLSTNIKIDVVVSPTSPFVASLTRQFAELGIQGEVHAGTSDFASLANRCDLAISAAGSTLHELAYLGVPTIAVAIAHNQIAVGREMGLRGAVVFLGTQQGTAETEWTGTIENLLHDAQARVTLSERGRRLIDGAGANRVAIRLATGIVSLRPAQFGDWKFLLELRNEESVRKNSFDPTPVDAVSHQTWLKRKLNDDHVIIWIGQAADGQSLGQIRLERDPSSGVATISIAIVESFRGLGLAEQLIRLVCLGALERPGIRAVRAMVKSDNLGSIRAFEKAGFREPNESTPHDTGVVILDWTERSNGENRTESNNRSRVGCY